MLTSWAEIQRGIPWPVELVFICLDQQILQLYFQLLNLFSRQAVKWTEGHSLVILATGKAEAGASGTQGLAGVQHECKAGLENLVRLCLKRKSRKSWVAALALAAILVFNLSTWEIEASESL